MNIRQEFLAAKFNEWLDRFSPPRRIANDTQAQQQDANSMLETIVRFAPRDAYAEWLTAMLRRLEDGMTTRSWPAPGEVVKACKGGATTGQGLDVQVIESAALDRMESWFRKFGDQFPGHGNPARTAALIERGVLKNLREARYRGFDLTQSQTEEALKQEIGYDERVHHEIVLNRLLDMQERNGYRREEIMRGRAQFANGTEKFDAGQVDEEKPRPKQHWAETAEPDSMEWRQLRASRAANPLCRPLTDEAK